jgi:hypothetical protein
MIRIGWSAFVQAGLSELYIGNIIEASGLTQINDYTINYMSVLTRTQGKTTFVLSNGYLDAS